MSFQFIEPEIFFRSVSEGDLLGQAIAPDSVTLDLIEEISHIQQLLTMAQHNLIAQELSMEQQAASYIRLCCAALYAAHQLWGYKQPISLYTYPLKALKNVHAEWWNHCWVGDRRVLKSNVPTIHSQLRPLECFIERFRSRE